MMICIGIKVPLAVFAVMLQEQIKATNKQAQQLNAKIIMLQSIPTPEDIHVSKVIVKR